MNSEYNDRLFFLNQVDLDTDLLDNVNLHQVVIKPTKNKECRSTQIEIKDNNIQKDIIHKKQETWEFRYPNT